MTNTKALREILPQLEQAGDRLPDKCLGRLLCGLHGVPYKKTISDNNHIRIFRADKGPLYWDTHFFECPRDRCPDVDLSAADSLVKGLLPGWRRISGEDDGGFFCEIFSPIAGNEPAFEDGRHPTSEPLAVLIALTKAMIAQAEQETADA